MRRLYAFAMAAAVLPTSVVSAHHPQTVEYLYPSPRGQTNPATGFDPWDLSFIKKIAAIGDSYSAGIGAGKRLGSISVPWEWGDWQCSRYDMSYPYLVNENSALGDQQANGRKFQFHSCSGALATEVIADQVPRLDAGQNVIMVSAGGNDADFVYILNSCVYQWFNPTKIPLALLDLFKFRGIYNLIGKFKLSCSEILEESSKIIQSQSFSSTLDTLLSKAKGKLASGGTIYYTGYAKFWAEEMTDNDWCSQRSWSTLLSNTAGGHWWSYDNFHAPVKLTKDVRTKMNNLVNDLNGKLKEAVQRAGNNVVFVDHDEFFGYFGARFCEAGVQEPDYDRNGLGFFGWNFWDPLGTSPFKREYDQVYNGTFEFQINQMVELSQMIMKNQTQGNASDDTALNQKLSFPNIIGDGHGRTFHPQIGANAFIADYIVYEMVQKNRVNHNLSAIPDIVTITGECNLPQAVNSPGHPTCSKETSKIPYKILNGVYGKFCEKIKDNPSHSLSLVVESDGDPIPTSNARTFCKRTPPEYPDNYLDYEFKLGWKPKGDGAAGCSSNCSEAFYTIAQSPCGHQGAGQSMMAVSGALNAGCGTYTWSITSVPAAGPSPTLGPLECNWERSHGDIHGDTVGKAAKYACADFQGIGHNDPITENTIKPGDPTKNSVQNCGNAKCWFSLEWLQNCSSAVRKQQIYYPLPNNHDITCPYLLEKSYKDCNNKGTGGRFKVGCVRYMMDVA